MALVPVVVAPADGALVELEDIGSSVESLARVVESQKSLFYSQIDQLQKLVVAQCKLTGVNPLSQEMAAGALSIKIGKRPRDMLNPKAIKYMQSIFSIKDTIGKRETREISALCGITVTQVRDYISSQRSRVRKLVNLSRDKATRLEVSPAISDGCPLSPDQPLLVSKEESNNMVDDRTIEECTQVLETSGNLTVACAQVPEDSRSATTVCTRFPAYSGNTTIPCSQVIMDSENTIPVFTQVPGNMGIVIPYYTQVPVYVTQYSADVATVCTQNPVVVSAVQGDQPNPIKTDLNTVEGGPSSSQKEETIPGVDSDDKRFLENIFNLMRKDQTFSGQVKLMEWVLQIHNTAVLSWFSTKGGITILATWLSQAALEEQTTVLLVLFKVLCHLPLHKALPAQMSAILQTVNRLRFYRTSDISNRAKILLSRWSKMFVRSQALRNPSSRNLSKNAQELIRKDRISEILGDESWQSKMDLPDEILALAGSTDGSRKQEPKRAMKLLEFSDGPTKKHGWNVSSPKIKERRKVRLVENPDHKMAGSRGVSVARAVPSNQSRPMSADDIQKAKMRAMYMQDKYGKTEAAPGENNQQKTEPKATSSSQANSVLPANRVLPQLPQIGAAEVQRPTKSLQHKMETPINPKPNLTSQEQLLEKLKKDQLCWQTPPEVRINPSWRVGAGENSKEVEIQTQRNGREKETLYSDPRDMPPNPKEPWDIDMDFDDSLTMEIPLEQETDLEPPAATETAAAPPAAAAAAADAADAGPSNSPRDNSRAAAVEEQTASTSAAASSPSPASSLPEPDIELLAVLLKNPDIVYALTSGQGKNLTNNEMVALLDLVKTTGVGLAGIVNGLAAVTKEVPAPVPVPVPVPVLVPVTQPEPEREPTSLPSPTPPANATRVGWRSEFPSHGQSPQLQPQASITTPNVAITVPNVASHTPTPPTIPMDVIHHTTANQMAFNHHQAQSLLMAPQVPTTILSLPQLTVTVNPRPPQPQQQYQPAALQQHYQPAPQQHYQPAPNLQPMTMAPSYGHAPLWQQTRNPPEIILPRNHYQANNPSMPSFPPAPVKVQSHALPGTGTYPPRAPAWPPSASASAGNAFVGGQKLVLDSRTGYPNDLRNDPVYLVNSNNNNNNNYNSNNTYPRRNEYANGSGMETWGPQSMQSPDVRYNHNNFSEQRRESGRSQHDEGSRQGHSSRRHGERRWRDRDYDRDWDRDRDRDRHRNRRR